jgi:hypothetical protein
VIERRLYTEAELNGQSILLRNVYTFNPQMNKSRKYNPRSEFLISKAEVPRLLVEINSTSTERWPPDLIQMLLTGAAVVRFANKFLNAFRNEKNFVLCALFIRGHG